MSGDDLVIFEVPGKISTDHRPRLGRRGVHKSPAYGRTLKAIREAAKTARHDGWNPTAEMIVRVIVVRRTWAHAPDLDNVLKPILDGCTGVLWTDDRPQIVRSVSARFEIGETDLTHVLVEAFLPANAPVLKKRTRKKAA